MAEHPRIELLTTEERRVVEETLRSRARRRQRLNTSELIRVLVDGDDRAHFRLYHGNSISIELLDRAEIIEVRVDKDNLLLAAHLPTYDEVGAYASEVLPVVVHNGLELTFRVTPLPARSDDDNPRSTLEVEVSGLVSWWAWSWVRSVSPGWRSIAFAAGVLLCVLLPSFVITFTRHKQEIATLSKSLQAERALNASAEAQLRATIGAFLVVQLKPLDTSVLRRGAPSRVPSGSEQSIVLDPAVRILDLGLPLALNGYRGYRAVLEDSDTGQEILVRRFSRSQSRAPTLHWSIPRDSLENGREYLITVTGIAEASTVPIQMFRFTPVAK